MKPQYVALVPAGWPAQYVPEEHNKNYDTYFRKMVQDLAHRFGWETYHCHFPFFDEPGLSDLYLRHLKAKRRMWRELKVRAKNGTPYSTTPKQDLFIYNEVAAGGDAKVWLYPDDWFSGLIDRELGLAVVEAEAEVRRRLAAPISLASPASKESA